MGYVTESRVSVGVVLKVSAFRPFLVDVDFKADEGESDVCQLFDEAISRWLKTQDITLKVRMQYDWEMSKASGPWQGSVLIMSKQDCLQTDLWGLTPEGDGFSQCDLSSIQPSAEEMSEFEKLQTILATPQQSPQLVLETHRS